MFGIFGRNARTCKAFDLVRWFSSLDSLWGYKLDYNLQLYDIVDPGDNDANLKKKYLQQKNSFYSKLLVKSLYHISNILYKSEKKIGLVTFYCLQNLNKFRIFVWGQNIDLKNRVNHDFRKVENLRQIKTSEVYVPKWAMIVVEEKVPEAVETNMRSEMFVYS